MRATADDRPRLDKDSQFELAAKQADLFASALYMARKVKTDHQFPVLTDTHGGDVDTAAVSAVSKEEVEAACDRFMVVMGYLAEAYRQQRERLGAETGRKR